MFQILDRRIYWQICSLCPTKQSFGIVRVQSQNFIHRCKSVSIVLCLEIARDNIQQTVNFVLANLLTLEIITPLPVDFFNLCVVNTFSAPIWIWRIEKSPNTVSLKVLLLNWLTYFFIFSASAIKVLFQEFLPSTAHNQLKCKQSLVIGNGWIAHSLQLGCVVHACFQKGWE